MAYKGKHFKEHFPTVEGALSRLRQVCNEAGRLDERTKCLVRLGAAVAAGLEPAVRAEAAKAKEMGIPREEVHQAALLALPNVGYVRVAEAITWINDTLGEAGVT